MKIKKKKKFIVTEFSTDKRGKRVVKKRNATREEVAHYNKVIEDRELLAYFGFKAFAFDPGIQFYTEVNEDTGGAEDYVELDASSWRVIKPLLEELKSLRGKR